MHFTDAKFIKKLLIGSVLSLITIFISLFIFKTVYFKPVDVVIDPGHGGEDFGAVYNGRNEKDDNLKLALLVENELGERGISCKLTRKKDDFISLEKRCITANERQSKLFVALHRNSAENAKGVEVWINSNTPAEDKILAENILLELDKTQITINRGLKSGYAGDKNKNYFVNEHTEMPSCLLELGFITNDEDNKLYDDYLADYASAIADGIEKGLSDIYG